MSEENNSVYVYLFISRNKDNSNVPEFRIRSMSFISKRSEIDPVITERFLQFVKAGKHGEMSRMYQSVNRKSLAKIKKRLLTELINRDDFDLTKIEKETASIASRKDCSVENKWLFDFDSKEISEMDEFVDDIQKYDSSVSLVINPTPNGYAIVTDHGFDTRELLAKWSSIVTLKRDAMLFIDSGTVM